MGPKSYQIICGTKYQYWTIFGSHSVLVMASTFSCHFGLFSPSFHYCGHSYYRNGDFRGPKPSSYIGLVVRYLFLLLCAPIYGRGWLEYDCFMAKIRPKWRGCSRLDRPTWKVSGAPYHTPIHGRASLGAIFAISRHLSRGPGVQKMAIS